MRVECSSIGDFLENLGTVSRVVRGTIWVNITRHPLGEDKRTAVRFEVMIQTSCVVQVDGSNSDCGGEEGLEYLLIGGESCGIDYVDASREIKGSERAAELRGRLREFAEKRRWKLVPGAVSE